MKRKANLDIHTSHRKDRSYDFSYVSVRLPYYTKCTRAMYLAPLISLSSVNLAGVNFWLVLI